MPIKQSIFKDIEDERDRQDAKWGSQRHLPGITWSTILGEEYGEVCKEVLENNPDLLEKELVQCAAVCVAWLEALRAKRKTCFYPGCPSPLIMKPPCALCYE